MSRGVGAVRGAPLRGWNRLFLLGRSPNKGGTTVGRDGARARVVGAVGASRGHSRVVHSRGSRARVVRARGGDGGRSRARLSWAPRGWGARRGT